MNTQTPPKNCHLIEVGGGLGAPVTLGAVLSRALAPGRDSRRTQSPCLDKGNRGPLLEPDLGGELVGERLVAGPGSTGPGRTKPENTTWSHLPVGSPPAGQKRCPRRADPRHRRLVLGMWNITSLALYNKLELVVQRLPS